MYLIYDLKFIKKLILGPLNPLIKGHFRLWMHILI